jgi:hypothetical protein
MRPSATDTPAEMATPLTPQFFPFATFPQVEATSATTPPFSTVAAPTAVVDRLDVALGVAGTFPLFPFFPTEIRLKIWKANLCPQMLHIIYDLNYESHVRKSWMNGPQYRAAWRFTTSPATNLPNRYVCQESRAEVAGYHLLRLRNNVAEARWYNPEIDSLFFDTNARTRAPYDEEYYKPYVDNVLPPVGQPMFGLENLKALAISDALWTDWPFSWDNGTDVTCEMYPSWHDDNSKDDFKKMIAQMKGLEKLQIVRTGYGTTNGGTGGILKFKESEDRYGLSLLRRVNEWKVEKNLDLDAEVVQMADKGVLDERYIVSGEVRQCSMECSRGLWYIAV